ncbi:phospho-sugar mutase [uncultured Aeromicrobium sp.]|uniref:phospho-sugar mutase n=1 Tax=uncultured Aeromicrobium sp. TaxID=337820 RepID=UPI0025FE4249|nr:phospho-sugar mutase [uncultured Aeromicrobium sp.]
MTAPDVFDRARAWIAQDPDPDTAAELRRLVERRDRATLERLFAGRLEFGTAGLRGELGPGPLRMNRVVVMQAARGVADHLLSHEDAPSAVVGFDARHQSDRFARDTAEILAGAGVAVTLLPRALPTPVLAFAIGHLGCSAGIMVTASHNPPRDNGYKVYLADSSQIAAPVDGQIAARIAAVGPVDTLPRSEAFTVAGDDLVDAYVDRVVNLIGTRDRRPLDVVYTPLHGVGYEVLSQAVAQAGFPTLRVVAAQAHPDPDFPTVAFPNPEEPGAMGLALAEAADVGATLVLANDPDADRCAVGVRESSGGYRMLTGDELGILLADARLRAGVNGTYATSIVSSDLLGRLATAHGQPWVQTLTGFKWIGKVPGLAFGYEEALGYCVAPQIARDKDGISAALVVLDLASRLHADGADLLSRLEEIYAEHGWHATGQVTLRVGETAVLDAIMERIRAIPPRELGGLAVQSVDDLAEGYAGLPPSNGLRIDLGGGSRVIIRPSGTEPKLKCYLQVVLDWAGSADDTRAVADTALARLAEDVRALIAP